MAILLTLAVALAFAGPPDDTAAISRVEQLRKSLAAEPCPDGSARPADGGVCAASVAGAPPADVLACDPGLVRVEGVCTEPDEQAQAMTADYLQSPRSAHPRRAQPRRPVRHRIAEPACGAGEDVGIPICVTFRKGSAELTPEGEREAAALGQALQAKPERRFEIAGYTDITGTHEGNLKLSQERAQAVLDYLKEKKFDVTALEAKGHGDTDFAFEPRDPRNRRVVAVSLN